MTLAMMTATELSTLLESGGTSCVAISRAVLDRIASREGEIGAYLHLRSDEEVLSEAEAIDRRRSRGEPVGPLAGIPVAVKDSICTRGIPTTCGSRMLEGFVPPYDATAVRRLREAGAILLGKTNMDEFSMGSSTENSAMKVTRNPHALDRVPGGSSGGSAAAVAAGLATLAIGGDTGGSVRQPAAFCGVVGIKPTYGRVSRHGLIAYASSLDQIGAFGRNVRDAALLLSVIAGHDPRDSTSLPGEAPEYAREVEPARRLTVGCPREYLADATGLDPEVRAAVDRAISLLEASGNTVREVAMPHTGYSLSAYYMIACAEASSNLSRYQGCHYGHRAAEFTDYLDMVTRSRSEAFGDEVKRRILLGTYALSAGYYDEFYLKACKVRRLIRRDFDDALRTCDVLLHPTAPTPPFPTGEKASDPLQMYLSDVYSVTANLTGLPAISIPGPPTAEGLPVGIQLVAREKDELTLFRAALSLEELLSGATGESGRNRE